MNVRGNVCEMCYDINLTNFNLKNNLIKLRDLGKLRVKVKK